MRMRYGGVMSEPLTAPQRRALELLAALTDTKAAVSPKDLAKALWPDSDAWNKRNRGRRTGTISGAVGGTMPMNAARLLWTLRERGLTNKEDNANADLWFVTTLGEGVLAGTAEPKPKPVKVPEPVVVRQRKPEHLQPGRRNRD
jgi:hypothetical protein